MARRMLPSPGWAMCLVKVNIGHIPKNVPLPLIFPSSLLKSCLYHSYDVNRIAIFGTIPVMTAPRPLYKARGPSFLTISVPVVTKPRFIAWYLFVVT